MEEVEFDVDSLTDFENHYITSMLWIAPEDEEGNTIDHLDFDLNNFNRETLIEMLLDCEDFLCEVEHLIGDYDRTQIAHDFALSRNHCGCGFWEKDYLPDVSNELQEIAESFGEYNLFNNNGILVGE